MENLSLLSISLVSLGSVLASLLVFALSFVVFESKLTKQIPFFCFFIMGCFLCLKAGESSVFKLNTINGEYKVIANPNSLTIMSKEKVKTIINDSDVEFEYKYREIAYVNCSTLESYNSCVDKFNKKEKEIISNYNQSNDKKIVSL